MDNRTRQSVAPLDLSQVITKPISKADIGHHSYFARHHPTNLVHGTAINQQEEVPCFLRLCDAPVQNGCVQDRNRLG
jgi:hypothetical protein